MGQETDRPSGRPVLRHRPARKNPPIWEIFPHAVLAYDPTQALESAGRSAPPELALIGWPETLPLAAKAGVALISDIQVAVSAAHTARPQDWRRSHSRRRRRSGGRSWLRRVASLILRGHSDGSRQSEDGKTDKNGSGHGWLFPRYLPQHQTTLADRGSRISSP